MKTIRPTLLQGASGWRSATLAPFSHRIFRLIWLASLVSNFGVLIQNVGASWLMTTIAPSADQVALVQASTWLPVMLFSLPAGAAADVHDRRIIMLTAQGLMLAVSVSLAMTAMLGIVSPSLLLTFTFLLGCGAALNNPAWQSSIGDQVPRAHVSAAVSLNALNFNIARSVGPAIGGLIVASAGAAAAFLINTLTYIGLIVVLATWRPERPPRERPPERMGAAIRAGVRYARLSPPVRVVLVRSMIFGLLGCSVWALMPLIARDLLQGGPLTYGLLLGAFGVGAIIGALVGAGVRSRFQTEPLIGGASLAFGLAILVAAFSPWLLATMAALILGGAAWVLALSTFNTSIQLSVPRWVLGRTLSIYQAGTFGGMAVGSWCWGLVAQELGLSICLLISAFGLFASSLLGVALRIPNPGTLNLEPSHTWPDPEVHLPVESVRGAVVVTVEYSVEAADHAAFADVMLREMRRIRERDGALRWSLLQDLTHPDTWIERFQNPTWLDHLRQHDRVTVTDHAIEARALAFHHGPEPPRMHYYVERPSAAAVSPEAS